MGILSSPPKNKKPKLEICEFKYCTLTRDHQLSECNYLNRNKCAANHQKLKGMVIRVVEFSNGGYEIRKFFNIPPKNV